ncbi:MAG: class I SAM-dependent methyltransferase [Magnetococcales bacterium]|nr:class I SAM-dependent methyltransferase [Magnetococcales bacterium]
MTQTARSRCIVCEQNQVEMFLDLGATTLANKFVTAEELGNREASYPLQVGFCTECAHVQLTVVVPPPEMFEHYLYISSMSDTLKQHLYHLSDCVVERLALTANDLVVDVGSNDGTLLSGFKRHGVRILGVDPAENLAALAQKVGVETLTAFFGAETSAQIAGQYGRAKAITATNVFPHIPMLADFVRGLDRLLTEDGTFILEAHYLGDLLAAGAFDTVYHEHVSYWALTPMVRLFQRFGFEVTDVERLPVHHGQLRAWVRRRGFAVSEAVDAMLQAEKNMGMDQIETFRSFARQTMQLKESLNQTVDTLLAQGKKIAGYGAPAKGSTLLSFLEIGPDRLRYIADRSPLKQGRFTPGTHIPVVATERLLEDQPDYVLLLAWNFAEEIMAQQAEYRRRGGKFIIPVPQVQIVE